MELSKGDTKTLDQYSKKKESPKKPTELKSTNIITFNVGGGIFTTSKSTLALQPKTLLYKIVEGKFDCDKDEKGNYFIDRNPEHFGLILDYFRMGNKTLTKIPKDSLTKQAISLECDYYGIDDFANKPATNIYDYKVLCHWFNHEYQSHSRLECRYFDKYVVIYDERRYLEDKYIQIRGSQIVSVMHPCVYGFDSQIKQSRFSCPVCKELTSTTDGRTRGKTITIYQIDEKGEYKVLSHQDDDYASEQCSAIIPIYPSLQKAIQTIQTTNPSNFRKLIHKYMLSELKKRLDLTSSEWAMLEEFS